MLFIPLFLTEVNQGYWYTITSLAALVVFADLGFGNILLQFSAHEFSRLKMTPVLSFEGEPEQIAKLGSLFRFATKWLVISMVVATPVIFVVGFVVLAQKQNLSEWGLPWTLYLLGAAVSFVNTSILSFLEGCGQIARIQLLKLVISIIYTAVLLSTLFFHWSLYALVSAQLISTAVTLGLIVYVYRKGLRQLLSLSRNFLYPWGKEIFPLLVRYAISFASGYFIFQIYTPLTYLFFGPAFAGKVGISSSLCMAVFTIANVWVYTVTPQINMHVAKKEWPQLDRLFARRMFLAQGTMGIISVGIIVVLYLGAGRIPIIDRFLPWKAFSIYLLAWNAQIWVNSVAVYLRAHKEEPLVIPSVITAIWVSLSTLVVGKYLPGTFFFAGFLSSFLFGIPVTVIIWRNQKKRLHQAQPATE